MCSQSDVNVCLVQHLTSHYFDVLFLGNTLPTYIPTYQPTQSSAKANKMPSAWLRKGSNGGKSEKTPMFRTDPDFGGKARKLMVGKGRRMEQ